MDAVTDFAQIGATLFAAIGLILNWLQVRKADKNRRLERVERVRQMIFGDQLIADIYYKIEYGEFIYDDGFHGSDLEPKLDKLLATLDSLGKQQESGLIELSDLDLLVYEWTVIHSDRNVKAYLSFLDDWFDSRNRARKQFESFRRVAKKLKDR